MQRFCARFLLASFILLFFSSMGGLHAHGHALHEVHIHEQNCEADETEEASSSAVNEDSLLYEDHHHESGRLLFEELSRAVKTNTTKNSLGRLAAFSPAVCTQKDMFQPGWQIHMIVRVAESPPIPLHIDQGKERINAPPR